jgi:chemotaxis protein MotB
MSTRLSYIFAASVLVSLFLLTGCNTAQSEGLQRENADLRTKLDTETKMREAVDRRIAEYAARGGTPGAPADAAAFAGIENVEAVAGQGKVTVRIPGDVLFAPGQAALKQTSMKTLTRIADVLKVRYPDALVRVEGYTDTDPIQHSGWADNLDLSLQRAASVYRYLHGSGVSVNRMYAAGFGEQNPRATKALSRRVEIVVITSPQAVP